MDRKVVDLNVGYDNTCIVMDDGLVRCWGDGADFINVQPGGGGPPLDVGDDEHPSTAPTINLGGLATVVAIGGQDSAGGNHACALIATTGGVRCWGGSIDQVGQFGLGGDTDPNTAGDQPGGWIGDQPGENPSVFVLVSLGAARPTTVADLSLSAALSDASVTTGETTTLTYSLRNDGPATSAGTAAKIYLPVVSATNAAASAGSFNAGTGIWTVGTLAANTTATLQFTVAAATGASYGLGGEVSAASTIDPDSTPGNARAVEDDQDTATLVVSAAPGGPRYPTSPIALSSEARKLTARMAMALDARAWRQAQSDRLDQRAGDGPGPGVLCGGRKDVPLQAGDRERPGAGEPAVAALACGGRRPGSWHSATAVTARFARTR